MNQKATRITPAQETLNQLLACLNLDQHAKNQFILSVLRYSLF